MRAVLLILALAIPAYLIVPVQVTGSIYVVTQGSEVVPLPLTQVNVYPENAFLEALGTQQAFVSANCIGVASEDEAAIAYLEQGPSAREAYEQSVACSVGKLINDIAAEPLETVQANKNGEFTLSLSRLDKVVLVASAKRQLPLTSESYLWLQPLKSGMGFSKTVEFNNTNLVTVTDIRSLRL